MNYLDPMTQRWEHEERVRWLQSLYGSPAESNQPNQLTRLVSWLRGIVGSSLVSLGERLQPQRDMPVSSPSMK